MSLALAESMEQEASENVITEPVIQDTSTPNNSMYIYATAIFLPILIAIIAIIGIPLNKEAKGGTFLKWFAIFLLFISLIGMYMYHKQIDVLSYFKSEDKM